MSAIYDNWERLVAAVLKREEIWELCHASSRSCSLSSISSDFSSISSFHFEEDNFIIISTTEQVEESAYRSEREWVEEYEAGVYITLAASIDGNVWVKRASFSPIKFQVREAEIWWLANQRKVYRKYNDHFMIAHLRQSSNFKVQFLGKSEENTCPKRNENALSENDSGGGSDDQFVLQWTWTEKYEPGVHVTLGGFRDGTRQLERVHFNRKRFKEHEAEAWWVKNRDKVCEKYNIQVQFLGKSEENTCPKRNENALSQNDSEKNLRSKDSNVGGSDNQFVDHGRWTEQYEPGIYVKLEDLRDGTRYVEEVRFSRRRFMEHEADAWWAKNRDKVYKNYNARARPVRK